MDSLDGKRGIMHQPEMPKAYEHLLVEEELYAWWDEHGYFRPETQSEIGQVQPGAGSGLGLPNRSSSPCRRPM